MVESTGTRRLRSSSARTRGAASRELSTRTTQTKYTKKHRGDPEPEVIEETEEAEQLGTSDFPSGVEPAFVRVAVGKTHNMLNFESLRIDVAVTLPCRVEDVDDTYVQASEFVYDKMMEEEKLWLGKGKKK